MDVARLGLAHGTLDHHLEVYKRIRQISAELGKHVGIMVDLPGPKVRAGEFPAEGVVWTEGHRVLLTVGDAPSTSDVVHLDYESLVADVQVSDRLAFGDGAVVVEVVDKEPDGLKVAVLHGGTITGRPGIHVPSDRLRTASPTDADLRMLDAFVAAGVDMVALSFVRSAHDVRRAGVEPQPRGPTVVAKIETKAAVDNLEGIIEAAGAVMVARGDLGSEMPIEELPHLQKTIIQKCIAGGRPAITATQMLESMVHAPGPTRAEASDVANAVFDGSSVLMLSGETAIGHDPVLAVRTMARITERADEEFDYEGWGHRITRLRMRATASHAGVITDALTMSAWRAASQLDAAAIICLTQSGFTVRSIARFRPTSPILGFSPNERTVQQLSLSWGATPIESPPRTTSEDMVSDALLLAREGGYVRSGDIVVVLAGTTTESMATDTLRVTRVP